MRPSAFLVALALVLPVLSSCGRAPVDIQLEAKKIREQSQRWLAAELAKDVPTIVSFYAEDAIEMPSNTPPVRGREAIRRWYETWLPPEGVGMTFATDSIEVARSGEIAYERGTYRFTQHSPRGSTEDIGKYLAIWKRVDGEWKVALDMANSDRPCPSP